METERRLAAGGVVFRRARGRAEVALVSVAGGKRWGLPKGLVEQGENIARTAHREVKEETGLDGRIIEKLGRIEYFFTFMDETVSRRVFKIVYFFLMEYAGGEVTAHDAEIEECRWFPMDEALGLLKYDDEKELLRKARALIDGAGAKERTEG